MLLNLFLRLQDPTSGSVAVDGVDLRTRQQRSWRAQIGAVFQENFLFKTSVRENIRLGSPRASDADVEAAAIAAELHPLVARFELKLWEGKPLEEAPKEVHLDGKVVEVKSSQPGTIEVAVDPMSDRCTIRFPTTELVGRIGFLQPIDTHAGVRERLNNLGYLAGDSDDPKDLRFRSAVEEFQCDHALEVDGKIGSQTRTALTRRHGC